MLNISCPNFPRSFALDTDALCLVPAHKDLKSKLTDDGDIILTLLKAENPNYNEVLIKKELFSSELFDYHIPLFLFENSTFNSGIDYFLNPENYILNINQIIYLIIKNRLEFFDQYNKQFTYLLYKDIQNLNRYINYSIGNTYNTRAKNKNTYIVISYKQFENSFFNNIFSKIAAISEQDWQIILKDLAPYLQISSDTAFNSCNKIVLSKKQIYRSVGYKNNADNFSTIFESKQNIPARLKTHLLGDAKNLYTPSLSVYQQDCLIKDGKLISKDSTLRKAIIVFRSMDDKTNYLVHGEGEISQDLSNTLVYNDETYYVNLVNKDGVTIEHQLDKEIICNNERVLIGFDKDFEPIYINNVHSYTVKKLINQTLTGMLKLKVSTVQKVGNARITSNTGLKFVSKTITNLGKIFIKDTSDKLITIKPDVVIGMNSAKASSNTQSNSIVLAQAALAVELGYYIPSAKYGFNVLNTLDEEEINQAAASLPSYSYLNRDGKYEQVFIGLAYLNFTELASSYATFKKQALSFIALKNINIEYPDFNKYILDNYLNQEVITAVEELYKILNDNQSVLKTVDDLPIYSVKTVRETFVPEIDFIKSQVNNSNYFDSKLLNEDWNQGFYIDLTPFENGDYLRIPSAKTLKLFIGDLPDGSYSFGALVLTTCNMLSNITGTAKNKYTMSLGYLYDNKVKFWSGNSGQLKTIDLYKSAIKSAIYSTDEMAMTMIQSFIKPTVPGVSLKQVAEMYVPEGVIVVPSEYLYKRMLKQYMSDEEVKLNINTIKLAYKKSKKKKLPEQLVLKLLDDVPYAFSIRQPTLWKEQMLKAKIWTMKHFLLYMSIYHPNVKTFYSVYDNKDIALVNSNTINKSKSDCDGDLIPLVIFDKQGQEYLKKYKILSHIQAELDWIELYKKKEFSSNNKLNLGSTHVYKLYEVNKDPTKEKTYLSYLISASIAKGNVGPATLDVWSAYTIFECYQAYCRINNFNIVRDGLVVGKLTSVLTDEMKEKLSFIYIRLVQDNVIEGIKHVEGGSSAFEKYFLSGITTDKNIETVKKELRENYSIPELEINLFLYIINWSKTEDLLKAVMNFYSKYNKGKFPANTKALDKWEDFIIANSFFGNMMSKLVDSKNLIQSLLLQQKYEQEERLASLDKTLELLDLL